jgi:hypothetical protein
MANELHEIIYSKIFEKNVASVVEAAEKIKAAAARHGNIGMKREQIMKSTGRQSVDMSFDTEKITDGVTSLVFSFLLSGEAKKMNIHVSGSLRTLTKSDDKIFRGFYMNHVYPHSAGMMKDVARKVYSDIESEIAML